jgi:hypothetical protein
MTAFYTPHHTTQLTNHHATLMAVIHQSASESLARPSTNMNPTFQGRHPGVPNHYSAELEVKMRKTSTASTPDASPGASNITREGTPSIGRPGAPMATGNTRFGDGGWWARTGQACLAREQRKYSSPAGKCRRPRLPPWSRQQHPTHAHTHGSRESSG